MSIGLNNLTSFHNTVVKIYETKSLRTKMITEMTLTMSQIVTKLGQTGFSENLERTEMDCLDKNQRENFEIYRGKPW